ncbi:competence/damage-inducible protein A [Enterococcus alcedinis]|uniref:Putative competence-damage inducible protein n=1 Tax=Enterococcus alcedinis TaxID=1274384 RepID=A0A917JGE8_9ENTE|nr:competence/damage-inducible protein A [Enterococcus alcedinis]MBP2102875.1 nicotinamide-nucleotide amidase [Enterococcus alcedinis]GGI66463.1 putative competence-damage inducible protein [Enterococcus alcedinis]
MQAEIIAVGTELLLGQIVNTNATFLAQELANLGIDVYYQSVVGDNRERLRAQLQLADQRSDLIVLCGGLGPTEDDLTKQIVAEHVGETLIQDPLGYQKLLDYEKAQNQKLTQNNFLQTLILTNSQALQNPTGLAVGIFYTTKDSQKSYLLLPGPPKELKPMFRQVARPILKQQFPEANQLYSRVLRFYGIGESRLVTDLADLIATQENPTLAPYAKENEVTLRLTVKTTDESLAKTLLDELEQKIQLRVGQYFYGYGEENTLVKVVVELLKEKGQRVTAAESLTAGAFQRSLGELPGVSSVFPGGFVTYSAQTKIDFLQIDPSLIAEHGTVSQACVEAMASQSLKLAKTDYALAFTGVAGPDELEGQAVGSFWIGLATKEEVTSQFYRVAGQREKIQSRAVMAGLDLLRKELIK